MKVQVRWDTIYRNSLHNPQNHNIAFRSASVLGKRLFAPTERVLPTKRGTPRHAALFEALEGSCCYHLLKSPHHCFSSRFRGLMSSPLQYNTCLGIYRRSGAPEKYPSNPWPILAGTWPQYERMGQGQNCSTHTYTFCLHLVKISLGRELGQDWSSALGASLRGV